jgi:parallel beta-helix repeat protein
MNLFKYPKKYASIVVSFAVLSAVGMAQSSIQVPSDISTIQAAIDAAKNGDTILVAPGTYTENIDFKGKAITVTTGAKAFADAVSVIINGATDGPVVTFGTHESAAAVLNGFTVQGGHASAASTLNGGGIFISDASPTITNNVVANNIGCGIYIVNAASPLIRGNNIKGNYGSGNPNESQCNSPSGAITQGTGIGIAQAGNVEIDGNIIEDNVVNEAVPGSIPCGSGITIDQGLEVSIHNNVIRNNHAGCYPGLFQAGYSPTAKLLLVQNLFYGNTSLLHISTNQVLVGGTPSAPFASLTEINNTIAGSGGGQEILFSFGPSTIANNIFINTFSAENAATQNLNGGLSCTARMSENSALSISHNDIYNLGVPIPNSCPLGAGNLSVDPQFVNATAADFHILPSSPVVAAGDINAPLIPAADLDDKARTVCGTIDMGAYEIRPHPPIMLAVSPNPTPGRSTVTLTATLTGNCNEPTGLVEFRDGNAILGTAPINGSGIATFSTSFLFVGTHILTATYPGDFNFDGSTSNAVTEIITGPPTTIILNTVSPNPAQPLQPITMKATVASAYTIPTGTVTFMNGGTTLATAPVAANGSVSGVVNTLGAGTYAITAVYNGSTEYAGSTSNPITETVLGAATSTLLTAAPNPVAPGQTVTFATKVTSSISAVAVSGTVTFKDGPVLLGASAVRPDGMATFGTSGLLTGTHSITATYSGSQNLNSSISPPLALVVTAIPTSLGLNLSPNPASIGQKVTMNATIVAGLPNQVPMGTVTFSDQSGVLSTSPLTAGVASFSTTTLSAGAHQITATLNPSGPFAPSSASLTEVVNDFNFAVTITPSSLTIPSGDYQILTVTVTPSGGFPRSVNLSCSSLPEHAQCSFDPPTTKPLSNGPQTVKLLLGTSDVLGYGDRVGNLSGSDRPLHGSPTSFWAILFFPFVALCGLGGGSSKRFTLTQRKLLLLVAICGVGMNLTACTGKLPGSIPPGNYVVMVTAQDTDATTGLIRTENLNLQVTK